MFNLLYFGDTVRFIDVDEVSVACEGTLAYGCYVILLDVDGRCLVSILLAER